eukprot:4097846-Amphidinium_carterae.1
MVVGVPSSRGGAGCGPDLLGAVLGVVLSEGVLFDSLFGRWFAQLFNCSMLFPRLDLKGGGPH